MRPFAQILRRQHQELQDRFRTEKIIEREAFSSFHKAMDSRLIKVITGIRRCGKSVFAIQLLKGKKYGYVNFDDENLAEISPTELDDLLKAVYEVYGKIIFLFLDEIQNIDQWELFVNRLQRQGINIILTGSSAKLLSKELATHLTGRHLSLELLPFSFREVLNYKGISLVGETTEEIGLIKHHLQEYLINGGFPELLHEPEPQKYLQSLYSAILTKDVLLRYKVRYARTFRDLSSYVITNFAREASFNRLKNSFNLGSDHTAKNYLQHLEETYLVFLLEKFSYKRKETLVENRKVYVTDTGLIAAVSFRFQEDLTHIYENVVAIELLRKKMLTQKTEVYYWRNSAQEEVDFVVKEDFKVKQLIQVCYDPTAVATKNREFRVLLKTAKELLCDDLLVITCDAEGEETFRWFGSEGKIRLVPLWKWLLKDL